jgi:1-acyl-sn-glycerol-3-phosphate acyltransferase
VLPRRITFVGKAEYMDSWKTKYIFPAMGMIPIDRGGGSASERALNAAARVLERGELFGIYPEGTRSRNGVLHKGHTGPARLALRTGAPLVPVGLRGTRDIQPPDAKLPKLFMNAEVRFGKPITVDRYRDRDDDRMVLRQLIDEVMFEIRTLSGQEYVDTYATKKAESLPTDTAQMPSSANGHAEPVVDVSEGGEKPRRSSADVLNRS